MCLLVYSLLSLSVVHSSSFFFLLAFITVDVVCVMDLVVWNKRGLDWIGHNAESYGVREGSPVKFQTDITVGKANVSLYQIKYTRTVYRKPTCIERCLQIDRRAV